MGWHQLGGDGSVMRTPVPRSRCVAMSTLVGFLSAFLAAIPGACLSRAAAVDAPNEGPNLVFLLADDLGAMDLGCCGSRYYETPNLDRLAAEGMRFSGAYAAGAVCSPTRASILTGRYPARLHLTAHIPGNEPPNARLRSPDWIKYLRESEITYAEAIREAGFVTFHGGKWHVDSEYDGKGSPGRHGFEFVVPGGGAKDPADPHHVGKYTAAAEAFIEAHRGRQFLAVVSYNSVHVPLYEREELIAKYRDRPPGPNGQNNAVMAAMIERMDWSVGRILAKIEALGLQDRTAVVFFSDNGGLSNVFDGRTRQTIIATSNLPYRGGKSQNYDGGIRVPLLVKWPGVTRPGSVSPVPVISTDLYPTFLDMLGLPLRSGQHLDGLSLAPLLRGGDTMDRQNLFWHFPHYHTLPPHGAVRAGNWKLIEHYETGTAELFDLAADPGERNDLASVRPERARALRDLFHAHLEAIGAQMPVPNPDHKPDDSTRVGSSKGTFDPREKDQGSDPRTYVEDPGRDYFRKSAGLP